MATCSVGRSGTGDPGGWSRTDDSVLFGIAFFGGDRSFQLHDRLADRVEDAVVYERLKYPEDKMLDVQELDIR